MKIIFLNNYNMTTQWEQWQRENHQYPGHHLWGATLLYNHGIEIEFLPFEKYSVLKKLSKKLKFLGDLDQQFRLMFSKSEYDVIYSGHHLTTALIGLFRSVGIWKKPIIAITYQSFEKNFWSNLYTNLFLKGHDKLLCINAEIKNNLRDQFNIPEEKLELLEWGNDLPFYPVPNRIIPEVKNENLSHKYILSTGITYRDYDTLIAAFKNLHYPLKIHSGKTLKISNTSTISENSQLSANIQIDRRWLTWKEMLAEYDKAYAVAIPLKMEDRKVHNAIGLTSLLEAMSMQKAIVMTRNDYVGIDIEKNKIGIFVEPGDVKGWEKAISYLLEHPDETREMGLRARRLCEERYNLELFSAKLSRILQNLASKEVGISIPQN